ncbi:Uncharacterised protein [Burkholderia pseudomallei]|nr:Uncharacterised protein [Burkholderia pseudomallei]CAJ6700017.1 Uncharacterised protein [Burkholderia pseudomallei]
MIYSKEFEGTLSAAEDALNDWLRDGVDVRVINLETLTRFAVQTGITEVVGIRVWFSR